jgi:hypothetical protein
MLQKRRPLGASPFVARLLKLTIPCDEAQENIIGDLLEEFEKIHSKTLAYLWLSKQVVRSLLPLIYNTIKVRLVVRLGKRIR